MPGGLYFLLSFVFLRTYLIKNRDNMVIRGKFCKNIYTNLPSDNLSKNFRTLLP